MNKEIENLFKHIVIDDHVVCSQGFEWLENCKRLEDVWNLCPRADWMILNIGRMKFEDQRAVRTFIYRLITEIPILFDKTVKDCAVTEEEKNALEALRRYVEEDGGMPIVLSSGLKVWSSSTFEDITIIVATSCMWGNAKGAIMAAKAILGRMNAITNNDSFEFEAANLLRECISTKSIIRCYRKYIKEKV